MRKNSYPAFVLGFLGGGIVGWTINWLFQRRRASEFRMKEARYQEQIQAAEARSADLERLLATQKVDLLSRLSRGETEKEARAIEKDDLRVIKGIGPVIEGKLNQAGIYSFKDLGALTPDRLREIVGKAISRLADEDSIIQQARKLAGDRQ